MSTFTVSVHRSASATRPAFWQEWEVFSDDDDGVTAWLHAVGDAELLEEDFGLDVLVTDEDSRTVYRTGLGILVRPGQ